MWPSWSFLPPKSKNVFSSAPWRPWSWILSLTSAIVSEEDASMARVQPLRTLTKIWANEQLFTASSGLVWAATLSSSASSRRSLGSNHSLCVHCVRACTGMSSWSECSSSTWASLSMVTSPCALARSSCVSAWAVANSLRASISPNSMLCRQSPPLECNSNGSSFRPAGFAVLV